MRTKKVIVAICDASEVAELCSYIAPSASYKVYSWRDAKKATRILEEGMSL